MNKKTMKKIVRLVSVAILVLFVGVALSCSNPMEVSEEIKSDFLEEDLEDLSIEYGDEEDSSSVTGDLNLPGEINGTSVTWSSSDPDVIEDDGTVHRPPFNAEDKSVTLTASLDYGGSTETKNFEIFVERLFKVTYEAYHNDITGDLPTPHGADVHNGIILTDGSGMFSREGYNFIGWTSVPESGSAEFDPTETILLTEDLTLYPFWAQDSYRLMYDGNDGEYIGTATDVPSSETAEYNEEIHVAITGSMARSGYTFAGWNTTADGTGVQYDPTDPNLDTFTIPAENTTLYAQWTANEYSITYENLNGGTHTNPSTYKIEDTPVPLVEATETGYVFSNWVDGEGAPTSDIPAGSTGAVTLTAQWLLEDYSITYHLDGGTNPADNPAGYSTEDSTITLADATKAGYSFDGWRDAGGTMVTTIPSGSVGDIELFAQWTVIGYVISYTLNDGQNNAQNPASYTIEDTPIALTDATKTGYVFDGWHDSNGDSITEIPTGATGAYALEAQWIIEDYSITYNLNGGQNDPANPNGYSTEDPTITLADATRSGYSFDGWYDAGGSEVTEIPGGSVGDIELFAQWTVIGYVISYTLNDGQNNAQNPASYTIEDTPIALVAPTRTGYVFDGWYDSYGNTLAEIPDGTTGAYDLEARWILEDYQITYSLNDGINSPENPNGYSTEDATITLADPTRSGYSFDGWYNASNVLVEQIPGGSTGDMTLMAQWTPIEYSITYENLNGGTHTNPSTYTIENTPITLSEATRTGYAFGGWHDGNGNPVSSISEGTMGNLTLSAGWSLETYQITYNLDGGANDGSNPNSYTFEDPIITMADPTRTGYSFDGWYDSSNTLVHQIPSGSAGDMTLTAQWTINQYTVSYDENEATDGSVPEPQIYDYGADVVVASQGSLFRDEYQFMEWNTSTDGTGSSYPPSSTLSIPNSDITLYAIWEVTVPPSPPVVSGTSLTNNVRPMFSWDTPENAVEFRYSFIEGTGWTYTPENTFTPTTDLSEGVHTLYVQCRNSFNSWSDSGSLATTIDLTPPVAPAVTGIDLSDNPTPTWSWSTPTDTELFRYRLDEGSTTETSETTFTPPSSLAIGIHTLFVQAKDSAGNWSSEGSHPITVIPVAPTVSAEYITTADTTADRTPTWTWDDQDGAVLYRYQLDEGSWVETTATSFTPTGDLSVDIHTLNVQAGDSFGNWSDTGSKSLYIVPEAPVVTIDGSSPTNDPNISWSWTSPEGAVSFEYTGWWMPSSDHGTPTSQTTHSVQVAEDGDYHFTVAAIDQYGNKSTNGYAMIVVDITPPDIPVISADSDTTDRTPEWSWSTPADAVSYRYALDGGSEVETTSTSFIPSTELDFGTHSLTVRARDSLGNWSGTSINEVVIYPEAPVLSSVSPTSDRTPTWTWTTPTNSVNFRYRVDGGSLIETTSNSFTPNSDFELRSSHNLEVQSQDVSGNWSLFESLTVYVDLLIGDEWEGGRIFYLDGNGNGLIASTIDTSTSAYWNTIEYKFVSTSHNFGTGASNTENIVSSLGDGSYAAQMCADYVRDSYSDWYLPSEQELLELAENKDIFGNFANHYYWSSTGSGSLAYAVYFGGGTPVSERENTRNRFYVRAIRSFSY